MSLSDPLTADRVFPTLGAVLSMDAPDMNPSVMSITVAVGALVDVSDGGTSETSVAVSTELWTKVGDGVRG